MKKYFPYILSIALSLTAILLVVAFQAGWVQANPSRQERVGAPTMVSYQGQIWDGDVPYDGPGYFMFAIYASSPSLTWSNDGNDPPTTAVPLDVVNGLFSVNLGDTKIDMEPLTSKSFEDPTTFLQVWFSPNGTSWTAMPEQVIAAVPYALQAEVASLAIHAYNAESLDFIPSSSFQLRVNGTCPGGQAVRQINSNGSVDCELVENRPVFSITTVEGGPEFRGFNNSITIGTDGLGLISYRDASAGSLMVAHCGNIACTSFTTATIDDPVGADVGYSSSITIGSDGLGVISYLDVTNQTIKIAHCNDIACNTASKVTLTSAGPFVVSQKTSIAINSRSGFPLISFFDANTADLYLIRCTNLICTTSIAYQIDATNDVGRHASMVVVGNYAVIAHYDITNFNLRVSYFYLTDYATTGTTVIDSTDSVGQFPAIAVGEDGLPIIAYFDLSENTLRAAHCNNVLCLTSTIYDLPGTYGEAVAIAIPSDGMPIITFSENTSGSLRVVKCADINCSSVNDIKTLDTAISDLNSCTSISIGMDGNPLIAYYKQGGYDLRVIHCSSTTCQPYEWRR
jgi:hypothetical protein